MLDQSRTVRAGSTGASYSGQAVLASALAFPTQPIAMRKIVYQRLLDAFPHPSDAHALVEKGALRGCTCQSASFSLFVTSAPKTLQSILR